MYQADLSEFNTLGTITLACLFIGSLCGCLAYLFSHLMKYKSKTKWSLITTSAMFNSGLLGFPIILGVYGGQGLLRAIFFDIGNTIFFIFFGLFFVIKYGGSFQKIAQRSILFPPLLAIILGGLVNILDINIGFIIPNLLDYLSGAAIPIIMISVGLSLEFHDLKNYLGAASFVTINRLIISPIIAVIVILLLGLADLNRTVTIIEAGMPSAMLSLVLAINYDLDIKLTAACILLSTALSFISITILILLS
jgi:predicted permease